MSSKVSLRELCTFNQHKYTALLYLLYIYIYIYIYIYNIYIYTYIYIYIYIYIYNIYIQRVMDEKITLCEYTTQSFMFYALTNSDFLLNNLLSPRLFDIKSF